MKDEEGLETGTEREPAPMDSGTTTPSDTDSVAGMTGSDMGGNADMGEAPAAEPGGNPEAMGEQVDPEGTRESAGPDVDPDAEESTSQAQDDAREQGGNPAHRDPATAGGAAAGGGMGGAGTGLTREELLAQEGEAQSAESPG